MEPRDIPRDQVDLLYEQNIPGQKGPKAKPLVNDPRLPMFMRPEVAECITQGLKEAGESLPGISFHSDGHGQSIDDGFSVSGGVYHIINDTDNPFAFHVEYTNYDEVDDDDEEIEVPDEPIAPTDSPLVKKYKKIRNEKLRSFLQIIKTCTAKIQMRLAVPTGAETMETRRATSTAIKTIARAKRLPAEVEAEMLKSGMPKFAGRRKTKKAKKSKKKTRKTRR